MARNYTTTTKTYHREAFKNHREAFKNYRETRQLFTILDPTNSIYLFTKRHYSDSSKIPNKNIITQVQKVSDKNNTTKTLKIDLLRKGFPLVFPDMSKIKETNYFPIIKQGLKYVHLCSLKRVAGIYMITNKVTKKYYIGMSSNLYARFNNYLDVNRLKLDGSSRINKALLKYGFENFSITILEFTNTNDTYKENMYWNNSVVSNVKGYLKISELLRKREDFFINIFKPQYNIKRYIATRDLDFVKHKYKISYAIPVRVKNLLDKCLDLKDLEHNILRFSFDSSKKNYVFTVSTPKDGVKVNSSG